MKNNMNDTKTLTTLVMRSTEYEITTDTRFLVKGVRGKPIKIQLDSGWWKTVTKQFIQDLDGFERVYEDTNSKDQYFTLVPKAFKVKVLPYKKEKPTLQIEDVSTFDVETILAKRQLRTLQKIVNNSFVFNRKERIIKKSYRRIAKSLKVSEGTVRHVLKILRDSQLITKRNEDTQCYILDVHFNFDGLIENNLGVYAGKKSKEKSTYEGIKQRCYNPKSNGYKYYGAKGIGMSDEWLDSYETFLKDIGPAPVDGNRYSIERLDNSLGYSKENCVWATYSQQARNKGIRSHNTSGGTGVNKGLGLGGDTRTWYAKWVDQGGVRASKSFSISKYGDNAFNMAVEYRKKMIEELNKILDHPYSESYGE